jgi:acetyl-CoA carboxylase carboxyl transferase subunit beta
MPPAKADESRVPSSFLQCQSCKKTLFAAEFEANLRVCPYCGHHHRLTARQRIAYTFDEQSFEELDANLRSIDLLEFPEYKEKLDGAVVKNKMNDSVVCGFAKLSGQKVSIAVTDFFFMGGSMGSVAGEKITRTLERGIEEKIPVVIFCTSGGARMQEGIYSLMQIAKTTAAVERCRTEGIPFISVMTDPTMAGVLASYASIADVILAEPKAMVGFAGARVSKQAQVLRVPDDFQTSEFAMRSGFIDRIVHRRELRGTLISLVNVLGKHLVENRG